MNTTTLAMAANDAGTMTHAAVGTDSPFEGIVGSSDALRNVLWQVTKVAPMDSTVLVFGETGTGKELIARAIHAASPRRSSPFVSVNCAAIPQSLIVTELFGHERGAFTGALQRRQGRFEIAAGGTLFLDEVGELPVEAQIALLRVLQEREFERIGGATSIRANVRVVAATNRDLEAAIADGTFRSDLYYRLAVFPIEMPPLRARQEDIRPLVEVFVKRFAGRAGKSFRAIDERTVELLEARPWPGNVRELQNVIERSVILCDSEVFSVEDALRSREAPLRVVASAASERAREASPVSPTLEEVQREAILRALQSTDWTIGGAKGAAMILGVKRTTLQHRMRKLGIVAPAF
jgi:transcriptional regulator with GAF, ATPase, and Fis domain